MFDFRNDRKSAAPLLVGLVVIAALFLIPFAGTVSAAGSQENELGMGGSYSYSYHGRIAAIDQSAGTLTVKAGTDDRRVFNLAEGATVTKCGMDESLKNLKVGDEVTVSYFENGVNAFITGDIMLSGGAC